MMKLNTQEPGLHALLKPYEAALLRRLFETTDPSLTRGKGSGELFKWLNRNAERLGIKTMSRASVIFALNRMVESGFLAWTDATGKGGHQRRYSVVMTTAEFESHVTEVIFHKVASIFKTDWWRLGQ